MTWHSVEEGMVLICSCSRCSVLRCCNVTGTADDASRNVLELELVDAKRLLIIVLVTG